MMNEERARGFLAHWCLVGDAELDAALVSLLDAAVAAERERCEEKVRALLSDGACDDGDRAGLSLALAALAAAPEGEVGT